MGSIFLVQEGGELAEMSEQAYDTEDRLQELLAKYPNLLAGDQVDSEEPRRWLLISREAGVPDEEGGSGRWSVDHVFLDQDGIPTLVEVKRSSDTRIRREVVGQMLDYAANAVVYWPVEEMRAKFEAGLEAQSLEPQEYLAERLGDGVDEEDLWEAVKTNLRAGKVRLLFVADEIPTELRRIVEFLNGQMDPAEVLAVEIKQFVGDGERPRTLVPKVIGQAADVKRSPRQRRQWDEASFFEDLQVRSPESVELARAVLDWGTARSLRVSWGKGREWGTFALTLEHKGRNHGLARVWTDGSVGIPLSDLEAMLPSVSETDRLEMRRRLNDISGVDIAADAKHPGLRLSALDDSDVLEQFLQVLEWAVEKIKET